MLAAGTLEVGEPQQQGGNCGIPLPSAGCWQGWTLLAAVSLGLALAWGGQEAT